jgi:hypothetical protein
MLYSLALALMRIFSSPPRPQPTSWGFFMPATHYRQVMRYNMCIGGEALHNPISQP